MATKSYDEYEVDQLAGAKKKKEQYATDRKYLADQAAVRSDQSYDAAIAQAEKDYTASVDRTKESYRGVYDANAVDELVARRNINEAMANAGMTDSGYNATQQTAISLQRGRADSQTSQQKQAAVDALMLELDKTRTKYQTDKTAARQDIYAQADADILSFGVNADAAAGQTAMSLYSMDYQAGENQKNREYQTSERVASQNWQAQQAQYDRDYQSGENQKNREWEATQNQINRDWEASQAQLGREYQTSERVASQAYQAGENQKNRDFQVSEREASQTWQDQQMQSTGSGDILTDPDSDILTDPNSSATNREPSLGRDATYNMSKRLWEKGAFGKVGSDEAKTALARYLFAHHADGNLKDKYTVNGIYRTITGENSDTVLAKGFIAMMPDKNKYEAVHGEGTFEVLLHEELSRALSSGRMTSDDDIYFVLHYFGVAGETA